MPRSQYTGGRRQQDGRDVRDANATRGRANLNKARALVCTKDPQVKKAVNMAGYDVTTVTTGAEAVPLLRNDRWDLVATQRHVDLDIRAFLGGLSGERRRELFLLKVDDHFKTNDRFEAWHESADLVVHTYDLGGLKILIEDAREEKIEFYKSFRQTQRETPSRLGGYA